MEFINRNEELLSQSVPRGYYILDSQITRLDIYFENHQLYIDVYFSLPYHRFKADKNLKLHFIGVTEYEFYWNDKFNFYTVERYKFFKSEKGFYLSVDPYDESGEILEEDRDIIFCKEVEGYFI
jgi:hypothetical protein